MTKLFYLCIACLVGVVLAVGGWSKINVNSREAAEASSAAVHQNYPDFSGTFITIEAKKQVVIANFKKI